MKDILLTQLRDRTTSRAEFRRAAQELASILAYETVAMLPHKSIDIMTPVAPFSGTALSDPVVLVPILRSGLTLVPAFVDYFPDAAIGCIGLKRDEKTGIAHQYYSNMPPIGKHDRVIVLDPMIATGGSGCDALEIIQDLGISEERIFFVAIIASQQGLDRIKTSFPRVTVIVPAVDRELTPNFFITPGLGDFGDRYFGTE